MKEQAFQAATAWAYHLSICFVAVLHPRCHEACLRCWCSLRVCSFCVMIGDGGSLLRVGWRQNGRARYVYDATMTMLC